MEKIYTSVFTVCGSILLMMVGALRAQDVPEAPDAPIEMIRLRQQFQTKVELEVAPWREKYGKELQKTSARSR